MASQHVQRLISSSRSGKPFNKKLSMMTDCEFCPRRYASRAALRAHEKRDHMDPNEIWLCLFCPKTYICKSNFTVTSFVGRTASTGRFHVKTSSFFFVSGVKNCQKIDSCVISPSPDASSAKCLRRIQIFF